MIFFLTLGVFAAEWPENRCRNQRRIFVLSWGRKSRFPVPIHYFRPTYFLYDQYYFTPRQIHQNNNPICGSLVRLELSPSIFCCIPGTFMWWQDQEGAIPHALQSGFWSPLSILNKESSPLVHSSCQLSSCWTTQFFHFWKFHSHEIWCTVVWKKASVWWSKTSHLVSSY